jgi:hypothetical protein
LFQQTGRDQQSGCAHNNHISMSRQTNVNTRQICALVEITVNARQRQIVEIVAASVNPWADVFDVQRGQRGILLRKLAVLATIYCRNSEQRLVKTPRDSRISRGSGRLRRRLTFSAISWSLLQV